MSTTLQALPSVTLYYREGSSDKVYQVAIRESGSGFVVHFAYGRRGNTLTTGVKTRQPVTQEEAEKVFAKLVKSKQAKGYQPGEDGTPYRDTPHQAQDTGIRCQLLNSVDESELNELLMNSTHCMQEKFDGRRLMVRKLGDEIIGINRRGLVVALAETIQDDLSQIVGDFLMDGEAVGDTYHVFDLLEVTGSNLRQQPYIKRHSHLIRLVPTSLTNVQCVSAMTDPSDKFEVFHELHHDGKEGAVFKEMDASYTPGRPSSGGSQIKYKFYETASFIVTGHNSKRSIAIGLHNEASSDEVKPAGNVTIPPNHAVPAIGTIVEVRYLYAFRESGAVYQPTYLGPRDDLPTPDCSTRQLKYRHSRTAG